MFDFDLGSLLETSSNDSAPCCSLFGTGVGQEAGESGVENGDMDDDRVGSRALRHPSAFVLVFEGLQYCEIEHGLSHTKNVRIIEAQRLARRHCRSGLEGMYGRHGQRESKEALKGGCKGCTFS